MCRALPLIVSVYSIYHITAQLKSILHSQLRALFPLWLFFVSFVSSPSFLALLIELDTVFMMMISWVILLTPFAVLSLIAQTIGATDDIVAVVVNLIQLIACILTCYVVHFLLTYCCGKSTIPSFQNITNTKNVT